MEENILKEARCKEAGCTVSKDGICLDGLETSKCSHYYLFDGKEEDPVASDSRAGEEEKESVSVHSGNTMNIKECEVITLASISRLIIFAGLENSGKTTLLITLLELFQKNNFFGNYIFAGSHTLIGFEKMSFPSRIKSDRANSDTIRTPIGDQMFLHLKLK